MFLFIRGIKFLVTRDLPHSIMTSSLKSTFDYLKSKRSGHVSVFVTLIEGYLRAANRSISKLKTDS